MMNYLMPLIFSVVFVWIIITDGNPFLKDDEDGTDDTW